LEKEKEEDNKSGYKLDTVFQTNHSERVGKEKEGLIFISLSFLIYSLYQRKLFLECHPKVKPNKD